MRDFTVIAMFAILTVVSAVDMSMDAHDVKLKVFGKSGKIKVWRQLPYENITKPIELLFDSLKEVNADGLEVGKKGKKKHSFNTFASQEFSFSGISNVPIPNSDSNEVAAKMLSFSGTLNGLSSKMTAEVYMVTNDVVVSLGEEKANLTKGQVKITIKLEKWEWCDTCQNGQTQETGAFVDIVLTVISRGKPKRKHKGQRGRERESFDMGADDSMQLSQMIKVDDAAEWTTMPEGYPKFEQKGNKNMFTFRFPKFNSSVVYDPTLELGYIAETDPSGDDNDDGPTGTAVTMNSACVSGLFLVLIATIFH